MLNLPQLGLPEAWKPLFRALAMEGWDCLGGSEDVPTWTEWPVLLFENRLQPWLGPRYLTFLEEPVWCGNTLQQRGFSIAAGSISIPNSRIEAEKMTLSLTGDWEANLEGFVAEFSLVTEGE